MESFRASSKNGGGGVIDIFVLDRDGKVQCLSIDRVDQPDQSYPHPTGAGPFPTRE